MPKKRFPESQIIAILREAEGELTVTEVCRKHAITGATFYRWKNTYGGMDVSQAKELKRLVEENSKLKRKVGEQAMEIDDLRFISSKKW